MTDRMRVLIAYDGSACADAALDDLKWAGLPPNVECEVLSVIENWLPPPPGLELLDQLDRDQQYLMRAMLAASRVNRMQPGWRTKAEVGVGSPATVILEKSDKWKPDLIIVGAHGRSALGRLVFGSVSQKVLHEAHCSVRVARERVEASGSTLRLIIGVDGSAGATEAVRTVTARSWPAACEVRVICAAWPTLDFNPRHLVGEIADWIAEEDVKIRNKVDATVRDLVAAGLPATSIIKSEEPIQLLINEAESWKADTVFVGARGLGRLERLRMGSVSSAIAARARCSVEVVHTPK